LILLEQARHYAHGGLRMSEEAEESVAEVIVLGLAGVRRNEAVFGASTVTQSAHFAFEALAGEPLAFIEPEAPLLRRRHELAHVSFMDVPETEAGFHEVVTGVEIAVMF